MKVENPHNLREIEERDARVETLYHTIKNLNGKGYTISDAAKDLNVCYSTASRYLNMLKTREGISVSGGGRNGRVRTYTFDRYPITKNNEGYSDPTAAAILKKEEREEGKKAVALSLPHVGDVWDVKVCSGTRTEKFLVLALDPSNESATVCPMPHIGKSTDIPFTKIHTKPFKYFVGKAWGEPLSVITEVKESLAEYLDIQPEKEIVEVEKEVIKEVPVKVEVPVQVSSDLKYTEEDMQKMRADIWEECFKLVVRKESVHII